MHLTSAEDMTVIVCDRAELEALIEAAVSRALDNRRPVRDLLTARQAAEVLDVHPRTVLRWSREAGLPSHRIGERELRFVRAEIVEWATSRSKHAKAS